MSLTTFAALLVFSFVSSVTPGPNNIMLFASGVNFGFRATVPHWIGVSFGFGILLAAVGAGVGGVLAIYPQVFVGMKIVGAAYMLWLAWRIANAGPPETGEVGARPMTFLQAVAFQWVNIKAWIMAVVAMSAYTGEGNYAINVGIVVATFALLNLPTIALWIVSGMAIRRFLQNPRALRAFNLTMALALVASLWPMLKA